MKPIHSFIATANLPIKLAKLKTLAHNYWWCWNDSVKDIFPRIDSKLWEECNHNPVMLINKVSQERLRELANQPDFVRMVEIVTERYENYMSATTWYSSNFPDKKGTIAYFSMEYGIHESFPNYSGGLGVLSGDHLKSASDLGLPLVAVGLLYQQGYFRQYLTQNGWQNELYNTNDFHLLALEQATDKNGNHIIVEVDLLSGKAYAKVWTMKVGRVSLYLLDTNIPENTNKEYRAITDQLYGGSRDTRIQQEIVLGIGGMKALDALGIEPEVLHINEGHAAFALLERAKMMMKKYNLNFWQAKQIVQTSSVFTTHTPVPAGNESFMLDRMNAYMRTYGESLGIGYEKFIELGQIRFFNPNESFSMTVLGLKMTAYRNGVSKLHGEVSRDMWKSIWNDFPDEEVPITHVTNGIHTMTFLAREFVKIFDMYLSPRWRYDIDDQNIWNKVDNIPDEEIWREKQRRRVRLVLFARAQLKKKIKSFMPTEKVKSVNDFLNPDALTIGFARRFATYKRAALFLTDVDRLKAILTNPERPVQIIIAGKAHPHDTQGKETIQTIIRRVRENGLEKHIVFLEDYDMKIARMLVKGSDMWLNNPIRPLEASGTSGMKAALNGTLNISILDGWWDEGYDGINGFAIGGREEYDTLEHRNQIEANELYELLEKTVTKMFYERSSSGVPENWVKMMKQSIKSCAAQFSMHRMVKEYTTKLYMPALNRNHIMNENNAANALAFDNWKAKINEHWNSLNAENIEIEMDDPVVVGSPIKVKCDVHIAGLSTDDIEVQAYYGTINYEGKLEKTGFKVLSEVYSGKGNTHTFQGSFICEESGNQGVTIRVVPKHHLLESYSEIYKCYWAS